MTPEGKVKASCRKWLREIGCYVYSPVPMGYGPPALDDYVCVDGRFVAIEYKRGDKKAEPTARQLMTMDVIRRFGGVAIVTTSVEHLRDAFAFAGLRTRKL